MVGTTLCLIYMQVHNCNFQSIKSERHCSNNVAKPTEYTAYRQSDSIFLQSSELGPPRRVCPPPLCFRGWGGGRGGGYTC